jgi:hypothetical protein
MAMCAAGITDGTGKTVVDLSELMLPCRKTNWLI